MTLLNFDSYDSGITWTKQTSAGGIYFRYIESSSDGRYLIGNNDDDVVIESSDYGVTWTEVINRPPSSSWSGFAISGDGSKVAAVVEGGYIWTGIRD